MSPSAQYARSGLASPNLVTPRSVTHGPTLSTPPASRHCGAQAMQPCGVICQACANASRSTVAAASPRPLWMDGRRAKA